MKKTGYLASKKFRYGSTATAITVFTVALVVLANVIFTALSEKYLWYADMTEKEVYSLSDATKKYMEEITSPVNIYFAAQPDEISEGTYSEYTKYVYRTAQLIRNRPYRAMQFFSLLFLFGVNHSSPSVALLFVICKLYHNTAPFSNLSQKKKISMMPTFSHSCKTKDPCLQNTDRGLIHI